MRPATGTGSLPGSVNALLALAAGAAAAAVWCVPLGAAPAAETAPGPYDGTGRIVAPGPPQDLQASAVSSSEVRLTWSPPDDLISTVDHYNVYRNGTKVAEATDTTYTDTGLQGSTQYTYRVSAVNLSGAEGQKSDPDSATTERSRDTTPPAPPKNLREVGGS